MSDAPNFRNTRKFLGPSWLTSEGESQLVGYVVDALKDAFTERMRQGLLARFPQQDAQGTPAADDALAAIGRDRKIIRGINESSASYAKRLIPWLDRHIVRGNPFALLQQLADYLGPLPALRVVNVKGDWFSRDVAGNVTVLLSQNNWDWDGPVDARWARFWVVIYPNGLWTVGPNWGDPGVNWGDLWRTWGTTATADQVQSVRSIVSDWKPGGTRCVNIIVAFDNASFDPTHPRDGVGLPDGTWARWTKTSGRSGVPSRLSTARYWQGV